MVGMTPTKSEILANHEIYLQRKALQRRFGYDVDQESVFVIEKGRPVSGRILEAGTGKGYFALSLAQAGSEFTSFDISEAEQKYALLNLMYYGLEQRVHRDIANAESLPYEQGRFDVIFTVNMIHHLSCAGKVCDEFIRVLSPSGKIVISDLNVHGLAVMDRIHALDGNRHEVGPETLSDVKNLLFGCGCDVEKHSGANQDTLVAYRRHS
jgi:2-polyprenyl-3-methyl-5-hydroxy-6-metoxy-1,4-benzoquinol methylase